MVLVVVVTVVILRPSPLMSCISVVSLPNVVPNEARVYADVAESRGDFRSRASASCHAQKVLFRISQSWTGNLGKVALICSCLQAESILWTQGPSGAVWRWIGHGQFQEWSPNLIAFQLKDWRS